MVVGYVLVWEYALVLVVLMLKAWCCGGRDCGSVAMVGVVVLVMFSFLVSDLCWWWWRW